MVAGGQRRRRVLIEEKRAEQDSDGSPSDRARARRSRGDAASARRSYTEAAEADRQPPSVALLAVRGWTLVTSGLLAVCILAGLELVFAHLQFRSANWIPQDLAALDLGGRADLASWFSSILLIAAAFQATQIYRLRRHKVDDYRGRYRMWVWVPAVLSLMAMCTASGLHRDLVSWLNGWTDGLGAVPASLCAPLALCLAWTLICLRLGVEILRSRAAVALLALGTICYFGVALLEVLHPLPTGPVVQVMLHSCLGYLGHLSVFLAIAVYGRYVYRDAQGLVPQPSRDSATDSKSAKRQRRRDRVQQGNASVSEGDPAEPANSGAGKSASTKSRRRRDAQPAEDEQPSASPVAGAVSSEGIAEEDTDDSLDDQRHLSKSERRRLRKQKRREQQRRAA